MISLIVPTHNRAYALNQVLDTFYTQESVREIVFIDDCSTDNTKEVIQKFSSKYPSIKTYYLKNQKKLGASFSRWKGVQNAQCEYILFCDDDEFLGPSYAKICLEKIQQKKADIVSGRHFYRLQGEAPSDAITRFKNGLEKQNIFGKIRFKIYTDAIFEGDTPLPFTHGIFLTSKNLLKQFPIDPFYSKGNGFREESDFQLNAFLHGKRVIMSNDAHCVHMSMSEVKMGGQRVPRIHRFFWNVYYTYYFLKKYYPLLKKKINLPYPLAVAISFYSVAEFYYFFIRPFGILATRLKRHRK